MRSPLPSKPRAVERCMLVLETNGQAGFRGSARLSSRAKTQAGALRGSRVGIQGRRPWHSGVQVPKPGENDPGALTSLRGHFAVLLCFGVRGGEGKKENDPAPGSGLPGLGAVAPSSPAGQGGAHLTLVTSLEVAVLCGLRRPRTRRLSSCPPGWGGRVSPPSVTVHPFTRDVSLLVVSVPLAAFWSH